MNLFSPIRIILLLAVAAVTVAGFFVVPPGTLLPVHWNIAGEADSFMPRDFALLMPAVVLAAVWILLILVLRFQPEGQRRAGAYVTQAALTAVTVIFLAIAAAMVAIGAGADVKVTQLIAIALAVLLVLLGNALPKSQPNWFAGLRIPTTLGDPSNWQATHRLTAWLAIGGGIVLFAAAFIAPASQLVWWVLACMLVPFIAGTIYSVVIARRGR